MKKIGLMLLGLFLALVSIEAVGHMFPGAFYFKNRRYLYAQDADLGYVCNWQSMPPPGSAVDLIAVGDSFTNGTGALSHGEMYPQRIAARLHKITVNLGCPGYGTLQEEIVAEDWLQRVKPKWLILEIFPGNDWLDNYDFSHWRLAHGEIPFELQRKILADNMSCEGPCYRANTWLVGRSVLYTAVYNLWREKNMTDSAWYRSDERASRVGEIQGFAAVSRLQRLCAEKHVKFLVLLVRAKSALDKANPSSVSLLRFLNKNHIQVVDPYAEFVSARRKGQELFLPDGHWNAAGQEIAAGLIARKFREE